jgi:hypothetical protein|tara:strand:- start:42 stop:341 length:300 start_codon:yes stop_codon:yes gene_type:complete
MGSGIPDKIFYSSDNLIIWRMTEGHEITKDNPYGKNFLGVLPPIFSFNKKTNKSIWDMREGWLGLFEILSPKIYHQLAHILGIEPNTGRVATCKISNFN